MRIIGGEFRKRRLQGPPDDTTTRPIPDQVKESLFNILRGHPEDGAVLDCFAGTGSIGLEALSRGATRCVFVERDKRMAEILKSNVERCGAGDRAEVVVGDALGPGALSRCPRPVHLAFFDPPYAMVRSPAGWQRVREQVSRVAALLDDTGYVVLRTPWPFFQSTDEEDAGERLGTAPRRRGRATDGRGARDEERGARGGRGGRRLSAQPGERAGAGRDVDDEPAGAWGGDEIPEGEFAEMEEIEIDPTTPEGQALLEQLLAGGAVEIDDAGHAMEAGSQQKHTRTLVRGDLSIPGTIGPETHAYSSMAVHLYMKQRPPGAAPQGPPTSSVG